ncbi:hypothetical protein PFISCL1PPCAC_8992, partial [Pristionchus fissidentatus]
MRSGMAERPRRGTMLLRKWLSRYSTKFIKFDMKNCLLDSEILLSFQRPAEFRFHSMGDYDGWRVDDELMIEFFKRGHGVYGLPVDFRYPETLLALLKTTAVSPLTPRAKFRVPNAFFDRFMARLGLQWTREGIAREADAEEDIHVTHFLKDSGKWNGLYDLDWRNEANMRVRATK